MVLGKLGYINSDCKPTCMVTIVTYLHKYYPTPKACYPQRNKNILHVVCIFPLIVYFYDPYNRMSMSVTLILSQFNEIYVLEYRVYTDNKALPKYV